MPHDKVYVQTYFIGNTHGSFFLVSQTQRQEVTDTIVVPASLQETSHCSIVLLLTSQLEKDKLIMTVIHIRNTHFTMLLPIDIINACSCCWWLVDISYLLDKSTTLGHDLQHLILLLEYFCVGPDANNFL